jgi:predicted nucleic acid-binding protein
MSIDHTTLLFFDASCLIAAARSPTGGSSFLLSLCAKGHLRAAVSHPVLVEAERNLLAKFGTQALATHHHNLLLTPMVLAPVPSAQEIAHYHDAVGENDAHVVAAALASNAPFLLTLDKPLARRVNTADLSILAISPGDFIGTYLPQHPRYPALRDE